MQDRQDDIIAFLESRLRREGAKVLLVETHISFVLIGARTVYKLKRAVKLPYLDFSTAELRLRACQAELELNRRTAPSLYVAVRRVVRAGAGDIRLEEDGRLVDAVVEMQRFDPDCAFDVMAREGRLTPAHAEALAARVAEFHGSLEPVHGVDGATAMQRVLDLNAGELQASAGLDQARVARLNAASRAAHQRLAPTLSARGAAGFIRRGHGDMHLGNICVYEGQPTLFDCIEFNDELATTDVLYDLAFLLMDLWRREARAHAGLVFNRYLDATGDVDHLAVMPFFMAVRAGVRAHVEARRAGASGDASARDAAREYLDLAIRLLEPGATRLVAVGGLSGSGKSTLAMALAASIGAPPGARILSTDRIRKRLFGVAATERLAPESYSAESSARVYVRQRREAARVLAGGCSVIADGVFSKLDERAAIAAVARDAGAEFAGLWLTAPANALVTRVEARVGDASDANRAVVEAQIQNLQPARDWPSIDASGSIDDTVALAKRALRD